MMRQTPEQPDLERDLRTVLRVTASGLIVPPRPQMPLSPVSSPRQGRRSPRTWRVLLASVAAVGLVAIGAPLAWNQLAGTGTHPSGQPLGPPNRVSGGVSGGVSAGAVPLPVGDPPEVPFARGSKVQFPDGTTLDVGAPIVALDAVAGAVTGAVPGVVVARTAGGDVWSSTGPRDLRRLGADAVSGPVLNSGGSAAIWISRDSAGGFLAHTGSLYLDGPEFDASDTVREVTAPCCGSDIVIGSDDQGRVYLGGSSGILTWNAFTESGHDQPPSPVEGTQDLDLLRVSGAIYASTRDGTTVWGHVEDGRWVQQGSLPLQELWPLRDQAVSLSAFGTLSVLGLSREPRTTARGATVMLTDIGPQRFDLPLPAGATIASVTVESSDTVLVETVDSADVRQWIRCSTTRPHCELAMTLQAADIVPGSTPAR